jgi:hypothetical protein
VRIVGRRKKKLIVAFQFQFANQAAWRCDTCRSQGLETRRRCGWLVPNGGGRLTPSLLTRAAQKRSEHGQGAAATTGDQHVVWARRGARATECPKSYISSESLAWIERYQAGRVFGFGDVLTLPARAVDAFCVLETEIAKEKRDGDE